MKLYENNFPPKLIIQHRRDGKTFTFYASMTMYLDFLDSDFAVIYPPNFNPYGTHQTNPGQVNSRPQSQMQILWFRAGILCFGRKTPHGLLSDMRRPLPT